MRSRIPVLLAAASTLGFATALAQAGGLGGFEYRSISFERLEGAGRVRQVALPLGVEFPLGRASVDVGTWWASSSLTRRDGTAHSVSDLTDTQIRATYVFGQDAVVATLVANMPTGPAAASAEDYSVIGAVSPAFLAFPAPVYASGFSMVGGIAAAAQAGTWSIGLAGSLRVSDQFTPYRDSAGPITYKPGVEGRLRAGTDGLVGASQLTFGVTWSTFGTDQFGAGQTVSGEYRPGTRLIVEGSLLAPIGSSALSLSLWNFHRSTGDTSRISVANRENLAGAAVSVLLPAGRALLLEPQLEGRLSKPESGSGRWIGAGLGLRIQISQAVSLEPVARYDRGSFRDSNGVEIPIRGGFLSAFIRITP